MSWQRKTKRKNRTTELGSTADYLEVAWKGREGKGERERERERERETDRQRNRQRNRQTKRRKIEEAGEVEVERRVRKALG